MYFPGTVFPEITTLTFASGIFFPQQNKIRAIASAYDAHEVLPAIGQLKGI